MLRVTSIEEKPFYSLGYLGVGDTGRLMGQTLPFIRGTVEYLPVALDALVLTADLQGRQRARKGEKDGRLLGETVADEIESLAGAGTLPPLNHIGVVLAGDLFSRPMLDRRGGLGDVRDVWRAFSRRCAWVVGVAGNHDYFGESDAMAAFRKEPQIFFLDGNVVNLSGLRVAGVSGVIGKPQRPWRREEPGFIQAIQSGLRCKPDVFVLHEGPDCGNVSRSASPAVGQAFEQGSRTLVICGHARTRSPMTTIRNGTQVLNVHERLVVLVPAKTIGSISS